MRKNKHIKRWFSFPFLVLVCLALPPTVFGQSSSQNYRAEEVYFGVGGELDASSINYGSQQSAGSLGAGNTSSDNFDATGGALTPSEPFLEAAVLGGTVDLGTLSDSSTSHVAAQGGSCNCSFYVRTYMSSEYVVITASQPPTNESGDVLDPKTTPGAPSSDPAVEEFGINLVENTVPGTFGAGPQNIPDDSFADGEAADGYDTPDQFKYSVGDVIARSQATPGNQAVGLTHYTISYIAKASGITPAGSYQMNHEIVVVATF